MSLQLAKSTQQLLPAQKTAYATSYPIIRTSTWLPFLNFFLPALLAEDELPSLIYLLQDLALSLTPTKHCTTCHLPLPAHPRPELPMCSDCLYSDWGRYVLCVLKGSGTGFEEEQDALGTPCDPLRDPLCKNPLLADRCTAPHIVYLATFNTQIKVGTARVERWGFADGYLLRLLEQGLDYAILFTPQTSLLPPLVTANPSSRALHDYPFYLHTSSPPPLDMAPSHSPNAPGFSLSEAQTLEAWILQNFPQTTEKLTFNDKYHEILNTGPNPNASLTPDLVDTRAEANDIADEIVRLYPTVELQKSPPLPLVDNIHGTLAHSDALPAPVAQAPLDLVCTIKYARGNLVFAYHPRLARDFWFNTNHLLGRGIVMEEPWP